MECMSSWVGSLLSCCHREIWPGLGVVVGYGRILHALGGGVGGVEGFELVMSGSVGEVRLEGGGVGGSESVVAMSVVGLSGGVAVDGGGLGAA
jgi:hypothetical protein